MCRAYRECGSHKRGALGPLSTFLFFTISWVYKPGVWNILIDGICDSLDSSREETSYLVPTQPPERRRSISLMDKTRNDLYNHVNLYKQKNTRY